MDPRLYILQVENDIAIVPVHVDDMMVTGSSDNAIAEAAKRIKGAFDCTEDLNPTEFLGIAVQRDREKGVLTLDLSDYSRRLLDSIGLADVSTAPVDCLLRQPGCNQACRTPDKLQCHEAY